MSVGPFRDQAELLRFALALEAMPGLGHIDLIDAQLASALFVMHGPSAAEVAVLLARLADYTITATAVGNLVSARVQDRPPQQRGPEAILYGPPATRVTAETPVVARPSIGEDRTEDQDPRWWRRAALAIAVGAGGAGILLATLNGLPWQTTTAPPAPPVGTRAASTPPTATPGAIATASFLTPPPATPTASTSATAATPAAGARATATTPAPAPTPASAATAATAATSRYSGSFSGALGSIRSMNGCVWDTPVDGTLTISLATAADGTVSGRAILSGAISYLVNETPEGGTCDASSAAIDATGTATGGGTVRATLSGPRELVVTFSGSTRGNTIVGDLSLQRVLTTLSTFGSTTETRSTTITGVTLAR